MSCVMVIAFNWDRGGAVAITGAGFGGTRKSLKTARYQTWRNPLFQVLDLQNHLLHVTSPLNSSAPPRLDLLPVDPRTVTIFILNSESINQVLKL